jgi:phosphoribosylformimino-5-aminoimidazole carboxamide ribotide isomerase
MIEIIPAIDLIDGKCVRLSQGDFTRKKTYSDDPLEVAKTFAAAGSKRLHIVDLDGAKSGQISNLKTLEKMAANTALTIDFGGGIKTDEDIKAVFSAGAAIASIGSVAVKDPARFSAWVEVYGGEKILLGADVRDGKIAIDGWQTATGIDIISFLREKSVSQAFVTDIAKDGLLAGPAIDLYKQVREALPELRLIASGGVSTLSDIDELDRAGCHAVIVGKAIYEGRISIEDLAEFNENAGKKNNTLS